MGNLMSYVEHLSETIGPRPATTDAEEHAAHFVRDVFESRGVEVQLQAFDSPRTDGWAFAIYYALSVVAALVSRVSAFTGLVLGVAAAVLLWLDLDTRWGLSALLPKGPSQNVIARHVPRLGRNERVPRVIVVAHYDSARESLAFSPGMVRNFATMFALTKACVVAVPALVLLRMVLGMVPAAAALGPWGWYLNLVPAAYLLIPFLIAVHRELFMHASPGANDNASGVAAMLGVFERLVPEPDAATIAVREVRRMRAEEPAEPEGVPEGGLLNYSPVSAPARRSESWTDDDDISWDTGVISGQTALGLETRAASAPFAPSSAAPSRPIVAQESASPTWDDADEASMKLFGAPAWKPPAPAAVPGSASAPADVTRPSTDTEGETAPFDALSAAVAGTSFMDDDDDLFAAPAAPTAPTAYSAPSTTAEPERHGVRDWLGLGSDFDARKKGKDIGSWDNFDDEDETGWKGGAAAIDDESDPDYTASIASRIRRKVTMNVDRELVEKEVWFVATGAQEVGGCGMKAFLAEYGHELKDAFIINIESVGSGSVSFVTREGAARRYESDRRLLGATRRAVREAELMVKGREYRGLATDATPALARGLRAMSVMAFDVNGRLPNWHWHTDTADAVSDTNLQTTVDLVSAVIKEL